MLPIVKTNHVGKKLLAAVSIKKPLKTLNNAELVEASTWVSDNKNQIPPNIFLILEALFAVYSFLATAKTKHQDLLKRLRESMGLEPKTERFQRENTKTVGELLEGQAATLTEKLKVLKDQLKRYKLATSLKRKNLKAKRAKDKTALDSKLAIPSTKMFSHGTAVYLTSRVEVSVAKVEEFTNPVGLHTVKNSSEKLNINVSVDRQTIVVETVTDPRTGQVVTANTDHIGPKGYKVTWNTVAQFVVLSVMYAIPANRLAKMFSSYDDQAFSSTNILDYLKLAANTFKKIYLHLFDQLAEAKDLQGDDTNTRCLEMERLAKDWAEPEIQNENLVTRVAEHLGRLFKKRKSSVLKKKINISVLYGKSDEFDVRSSIFFFRTHFGNVGDLLGKLLETRKPSNRHITFLGDLSTTNYPTAETLGKFQLKIAGCSAHARRPFWRYRHDDGNLCGYMLRGFLIIANIERDLVEEEYSWDEVLHTRKKFSLKVYEALRRVALRVIDGKPAFADQKSYIWPKGTKLYEACAYLVKHYDELTAFIYNPFLPATNNLIERVHRPEKLHLVSSKFRKSEEGRVVIDILRTILTTCQAAEINVLEYMIWVFQNSKKADDNPELFTPFAYAKMNPKK